MATASSPSSGLFSAPASIRTLFKSFPLAVHPAEALPARSPDTAITTDQDAATALPRLYVFAHAQDAARGLASYNPSCLKWQTILRIANIDVVLVPSSNHASPSGALPFLLLPSTAATTVPLTGERIARYARQHAPPHANLDDPSPRIDAYQALIANSIRPAWLHALYINPANDSLLASLYLSPSSILLHPAQRAALRAAATTEILKATRRTAMDIAQLYDDAEAAFAALSQLLDNQSRSANNSSSSSSIRGQQEEEEDAWFGGAAGPGVLDADVFAYTHLLLPGHQGRLPWSEDDMGNELATRLQKFGNLVRHAEKLYARYWKLP